MLERHAQFLMFPDQAKPGDGLFPIEGANAELDRFERLSVACDACCEWHGFPTDLRSGDIAGRTVPAAVAAAVAATELMERINHAAIRGEHGHARQLSHDLAEQMRIVQTWDSAKNSDSTSETPKKHSDCGSDSPNLRWPKDPELCRLVTFARDLMSRSRKKMKATDIVREFKIPEKDVQNTARQLRDYGHIWKPANSESPR